MMQGRRHSVAEIIFDPDGHKYSIDDHGRRWAVPGVSFLLEWRGLADHSHYRPGSGHRGSMIHRACALDAQKILDEKTLDPDIIGEVDAWKAFSVLIEEIIDIEFTVGDARLGFAGRADFKLKLKNRKRPVIGELKSGAKQKWHRQQVAAYVRGGNEDSDGLIIYVKRNSNFSLDLVEGVELIALKHEWEAICEAYHREQFNIFKGGL